MKYYLGPILWMGLIFFFSSDAGSASHTNTLFVPIIKFFYPNISRRDLVITLVTIRKISHVVEYAILSILWLVALRKGNKEPSWRPILGAIGISVVYAVLDELHQAFVASRTSSVLDVGLDSTGALLGQVVLGINARFKTVPSAAAKFFGWWFAWGAFSTVMVLIVLKGGALSFWKMTLLILAVGVLSGTGGVLYHVRKR